jgi:hypothetical protein
MNILKLQDELKSVPDNALVGYVQNPTGHVPSYLALSELQRRKDMREKYQQAQPEKTTVAEDLEQQAQPQPQGIAAIQQPAEAPVVEPGLAGLPVPDQMFSGQGMAAGGIVAFDDGGDVKGYAGPDGSYVNPGLIGGPTQESLPWYSGINEFLNRNFDWSATNRAAREKGIGDEVTNPFISGMPRTDIMQEYLDIRQRVNTGKGSYQDIERMKQIEGQGVPPTQTPGGGGYVPGQKTQADIQADLDRQRQLAKDKENAIKNIYAPKGGTAKESAKSLADYAKEFRDVVGEDPMQAKLAARMEKMDASAAKQAEQAPWMALAQAGFGIAAGKSPYALQNIATGALEGVKSYGDAKDKMAALEDKRFALMADMAKSQRAEQLAIASKGADSRDAQLARDQQERLNDKKMANDMQMRLLDNIYDLRGKEITAAQKDQPDATARATKIWPLVPEQPEYKEKMKALLETLGPEASTPGTRNHNKFLEGRQAIQNEVYTNIIRKPGMGTTGATYNYVPGKGIMPL